MRFAGSDHRDREERHKIYGVVIGVVTNIKDDLDQYRIKVKFPFLNDTDESDWCRIVTQGAGGKDDSPPGRGLFCLPEVNDEVLVAFEHGDIARPYILGTVWNGKDKPHYKASATVKDGKNTIRAFRSRTGHYLEFDDTSGKEKITIKSKGGASVIIDDDKKKINVACQSGKNTMEIDSTGNKINVTSEGDITIKAKTTLTLDAKDIVTKSSADTKMEANNFELTAKGTMKLKSNGQGNVEAGGTLTVKGSTVNIN